MSSISNPNLIQTQQTTNGQITPQSINLANQQQSTANSKIQISSQQPTYIKRTVRSEKMNDESNAEEQQQPGSQELSNPYYNKLVDIQRSIKDDKINQIKESGLIETTSVSDEAANEELSTTAVSYTGKSNEENESTSTIAITKSTSTIKSPILTQNISSKLDSINDDSSLDWSSLIDNDSEKTIYESFYELLDNDLDKKGRYERKSNNNKNKLNKSY